MCQVQLLCWCYDAPRLSAMHVSVFLVYNSFASSLLLHEDLAHMLNHVQKSNFGDQGAYTSTDHRLPSIVGRAQQARITLE